MSFYKTLQADLRERQIFPAVVVLAVLAVGIPLAAPTLLGKVTTPPAPSPLLPAVHQPAGVTSPQRELADLNTVPATSTIVRHGSEPDVFRELGSASSGASSASASSTTTASHAGTSVKAQTKASSGTGTSAATTLHPTSAKGNPAPSTSTTPSATPQSSKPSTKPAGGSSGTTTPAAAPSKLSSHQAYTVDIATKDADGVHTLTDVVRLAPLPAAQSPEVIFLGVLEGGKKAVFLFTNAIAVSTKTTGLTCVPSSSDCQIAELSPGQGLSLSPTSNSALIATFSFELQSIGVANFSSEDAATQARDAVSSAGQTLLPLSDSSALPDFTFESSLGALVYHSSPSGGSSGATGNTGATGTTGATGSAGSSGAQSEAFGIAFAVHSQP
jgi:hypothetical protein